MVIRKFKESIARKELFVLSIALSVIIVDQLTKYLIKTTIPLSAHIKVIGSLFTLTYLHNYGAGFGILQGYVWLFIILALLITGVIIYLVKKISEKERLLLFSLAILLGGSVGNLIDRIAFGYVIDFINFSFWPAFNIADSCLSVGAVLVVLWSFKHR